MNVLFVTWDGPQVFYLESLFVPIFRALGERGWKFHVLQFCWGDEQRLQVSTLACKEAGLPYRAVRVWRSLGPVGAMLSAVWGIRSIRRAIRNWDIDVVMPRSTLPVLACMGALRHSRLPMVFDADGLPLDERVDFGTMSSSGATYRILRDVEAQGVRRAAVILTRTERAAQILLARAGAGASKERFYQVGNGRNANQYAPLDSGRRQAARARLGIAKDAPLFVYAGSLGEQYCLPEMLALFERVLDRRPDTRFLILTGSPKVGYTEIARHKELRDKCLVCSVLPADVSEYLACADVGLAFRRSAFSMQGVAPVKLGEYLLCGLPVISTVGGGNNSRVLLDQTGCVIDETDSEMLDQAASWFTDEMLPAREAFRSRCREVGLEHYSLDSSVASYCAALNGVQP